MSLLPPDMVLAIHYDPGGPITLTSRYVKRAHLDPKPDTISITVDGHSKRILRKDWEASEDAEAFVERVIDEQREEAPDET